MVQNAVARLRDAASLLPLATWVSSRNLGPTVLTIPVCTYVLHLPWLHLNRFVS